MFLWVGAGSQFPMFHQAFPDKFILGETVTIVSTRGFYTFRVTQGCVPAKGPWLQRSRIVLSLSRPPGWIPREEVRRSFPQDPSLQSVNLSHSPVRRADGGSRRSWLCRVDAEGKSSPGKTVVPAPHAAGNGPSNGPEVSGI